jgi:hypothetical protein
MRQKVMISLTEEQRGKAKRLSKEMFGKENASGLFQFLLERWEKENKRDLECR